MENIPEDEDEPQKVPRSEATKTMSRINNTRYLNQNIYSAFLQKVVAFSYSALMSVWPCSIEASPMSSNSTSAR